METLEEKIAKIMAGQFTPSPDPSAKYASAWTPSVPAAAVLPVSSKISTYDEDEDEAYEPVQQSTSPKPPKTVSAKSVKGIGSEPSSPRPVASNYTSNVLPLGSSKSAAPVKGNEYDQALMDALGIGPDTAPVARVTSTTNITKPHDWKEHVDHIEEEYEDSSDEQDVIARESHDEIASPAIPVTRNNTPVIPPRPTSTSAELVSSVSSRNVVADESAAIAPPPVVRVASVQALTGAVSSIPVNNTSKSETVAVTKVQSSSLKQTIMPQTSASQQLAEKLVEKKVADYEYHHEDEYQQEDEYQEEQEEHEYQDDEENADYDAGDDAAKYEQQEQTPEDYEVISPISYIDQKSRIMIDSAVSQTSSPSKSVAFEIPGDGAFSAEAATKKRAVITKPVAPLSPQGISPDARANSNNSFNKTSALPNAAISSAKKPVTPSKVVRPAGSGSVLQAAKSLSSTTKASSTSTPTRSTSASKLTSQRSATKRESIIPPRDNTQNKYSTPSRGSSFAASSVRHASPESQMSVVDRVIRVAVRVRPFSQFEKEQAARRTVSKIGNDIVVVNPKAFDAEPDTIAAAAIAVNNSQWANAFNYDHCLWSYDPGRREEKYFDQVSVHKLLGLEIVENALSGISCSCFAYGHTTTGKTYTLFGANQEATSRSKKSNNSPGDHRSSASKRRLTDAHATTLTTESGLVPRIFHDIVKAVKEHMVSIPESRIFFSYLEIYNEMVIDLLVDPPKEKPREDAVETVDSLKIREHPVYGPYVENLRRVEVFCVEDVFALLAEGESNRSITQTAWNLASSRSHAIAQLELASVDINDILKVDPSRKVMLDRSASNIQSAIAQSISTKFRIENDGMRSDGSGGSVIKVQMVDLAGSEKDSNDDDSSSGGVWHGMTYNDTTPNHKLRNVQEKEKKELKLIRRSLATLGYIIQSLAKGSSFRSLPYRDSVLTFLLRDALNGHNHTTMIATISPAHMHYEETLSTLRYADKLCSLRRNKNSTVPLGLSMSEAAFKEPRSVLIENFRRFHSEVSINFKGSMTQRQLLQQTVADPQQRIAKLTRGMSDNGVSMFGDPRGRQGNSSAVKMKKQALTDLTFTSPIDGSVKKLRDITADDLEHLQSSYRDLQGQLVEVQIDLDALRTDRDTLVIELRNARNQVIEMEEQRDEAKLKLQNATKSSKALEKEAAESRIALKRREEEVEKLLTDLQEQKQARSGSEHAYHARTKEFLARFDSVKKENKALSAALELANNRDGLYGNEKLDLVNQVNRLKGELEAVHKAIEDSQHEAEMARQENIALMAHMREVEIKGDSRDQLEKDRTELIMKVEALQCELQIANTERDSLSAMVKQKDSLLWLQTQQSEASIKMLQQRQAALERAGSQTNNSSEDFTKLVDSLKELFAREGQMTAMEALDTQKLLVLIKELKEKLTLFDRLEGQFSGLEIKWQAEDNARKLAEEKNYEMNRALQNTEFANSELSKQLVEVHRELEATRRKLAIMSAASGTSTAAIGGTGANTASNNNTGKGTGPTGSSSVSFDIHNFTLSMEDDASVLQLVQIFEITKAENLQMKSQLETANKEASTAKDELQTVQMTMQREFAALWMSVQELNKLDALKDKSIQELITERTSLTNERDTALERLHASNMECDELRRELQEIDMDLQRAVGLNRGALHNGMTPNNQNMMNVQPMFDTNQQQAMNGGFGGDRSQYYLQPQGGRPPLQQTNPMAANSNNGNNYRSGNGQSSTMNIPQQQHQSNYFAQGSGRSVSSFGDTRTTGNVSQVSSRPSSAGLTTPMTAGRSRLPPPTIDSGYGSGGQINNGRQPIEDDQDGIAEQLLMHQIDELSGFLQDEERLKRMRLMRSSTTNTGLPSPAPPRTNSNRSTGVDPRNGDGGRMLTPSNQRVQEGRR